ncbi:alpha/beta hydrolase [Streptomyces sp. NPDC002643]
MERRKALGLIAATGAATGASFTALPAFGEETGRAAGATGKGGCTFALDRNVRRTSVRFKNRYGIEVAGDLYVPKNASGKLPALAVSGPFGAVEEQSSGLYANEFARRGYVALAFDPSFTGESGGTVRDVASPDICTEDFSAAVDFLGPQRIVDRERIGVQGICGLSGMALTVPRGALRRERQRRPLAPRPAQDPPGGRRPDHEDLLRLLPHRARLPPALDQLHHRVDRDHADAVLRLPADDEHRHAGPPQGPPGDRHQRALPLLLRGRPEDGPRHVDLVVVPGADHVDLYDHKNLIPFGNGAQVAYVKGHLRAMGAAAPRHPRHALAARAAGTALSAQSASAAMAA